MKAIKIKFNEEQSNEGNFEITQGDIVFVQFAVNGEMVQYEGTVEDVDSEQAIINLPDCTYFLHEYEDVKIVPIAYVRGVVTEVLSI